MAAPSMHRQQPVAPPEVHRLVDLAKATGRPDNYPGKRSWPRYVSEIPFEATTDPGKPGTTWTVSLHNISQGGFSCWSRTRVEMHDRIFVRECPLEYATEWVAAKVRHCTAGIRGFLIGAQFEAVTDQAAKSAAAFPTFLPGVRPAASEPAGQRTHAGLPTPIHPPHGAGGARPPTGQP